MSKELYIALDVETGGLGTKYSLLTAGFVIFDKSWKIVDTLELYLHPGIKGEEYDFIVSAQGLAVNKIDLVEHSKKSISYKDGGTALYSFLVRNQEDSIRFVPVGHNMEGDLAQIWDKLLRRPNWETYCSYRKLDTGPIVQFMKKCGMMPEDVSGSLVSLVEHFKLGSFEAHTAIGDAIATMMVLRELQEFTKIWNVPMA